MLPIKFIRENLEVVKNAARSKLIEVDWAKFEALDAERRKILSSLEAEKSQQNKASQEIAGLKKSGKDFEENLKVLKTLSDRIKTCEDKLTEIESEFEKILVNIPNIPHSSVPVGKSAADNVVVRSWGKIKEFDFEVLPNWEIGEKLDILDFPRGGKITGSFFPVFKGPGASLVRALINFMIDLHKKSGFGEVWVPALVNRDSMFGTGQLPRLEEDMYHLDRDDFFLIPTAEVPVTNLHREDVLLEENLPVYYVAYTPCFRREAGSYGKDTRGLLRVHQFDKVEMVKFVRPEDSYDELESLVAEAEKVLQALDLPYRVVMLCTGELSFAASKCYDLEVWAPAQQKWLEVSSCSNFEDFQARRAKIRYRTKKGETRFLHTLNGSGIALPRTIIGILENYQNKDGSVTIPEVLRDYLGGLKVIK